MRQIDRLVWLLLVRDCKGHLGYVPVFLDGSRVKVEERYFRQPGRGYNGEWQYCLHAVYLGVL